MQIATLDFETYFADDYTLSKMTTEAYCRDPRFIAHGAAVKWQHNIPAKWYPEKELRCVLAEHDWSDTALICHHGQFDGFILSHHYNVHPKFLFCTLSMARLLLGNHISVSLDSVRKQFGFPPKTTPYNLFKNKHWAELTPAEQELVGDGCADEVESIWKLFGILGKDFPAEEYEVVDTTIRMFTEPVLRADTAMLAQLWQSENDSKIRRMAALGVDESDLQSADKFADLLRGRGVDPEMKDGKKGQIYAFAKTDDFMRNLLEDEDEEVRALAEARLGVKSTLLQTRAETLGWMASRGSLPVYLRYCGAHTTRWSGGDSVNWQNFKRVDRDNPSATSPLRYSIMAPEGHLLAPIDLSQIECRLVNYLAGQDDVIEKFRNHEDPYVGIATAFYGRPITKNDANERGTGKQAELSCGYGCGGPKFQATAKLGIYGPPVYLPSEEAKRFVDLYRATHPAVVRYWGDAGRMISKLAGGTPVDWGPMHVKDGRIYAPNGTMLHYNTLEYYRDDEYGDSYWRMKTRNGWSKLYGAKLVENVMQWLARIVMSQAMIRIRRLGYHVVNTTHDELLMLFPEERAQESLQVCLSEMKRTPTWLPGLPLDAEGSLGPRYSK